MLDGLVADTVRQRPSRYAVDEPAAEVRILQLLGRPRPDSHISWRESRVAGDGKCGSAATGFFRETLERLGVGVVQVDHDCRRRRARTRVDVNGLCVTAQLPTGPAKVNTGGRRVWG